MANKSLVILGNGFDKALNFPTGYYDFYSNSKELKHYAMGGNKLCEHIINNLSSDLWSDLESGLYEYSMNLTQKYGKNHLEETQRFHKEFNELRNALFKYLDSISETPQNTEQQLPILGLNIEWRKINPHYITFNYSTNTLVTASCNSRDFLNNDDSINENKFIYQHGSIYDTKNTRKRTPDDIVLGIDYEKQKVEEAHSFLYKSQQNIHNLDKIFQLFNEAQLLIIYGCSLGDSDMIYFKEIFSEAQEGKTFLIYGYGPDSLSAIETNIEKISANYPKFNENNTLIFLDVKEVERTREETRRILEDFIN